jgi:competence protein ComEA
MHAYGSSRWGSRPTQLDRGAGLAYRIDLNHAAKAELLQIPGVGESLAARIEEYRREVGQFESVEQLTAVKGIGPAMLERLRPWVSVQPTGAGGTAGDKKAQSLTELIDVNRAPPDELQRLPGIGPKLSQRILDERRKGPFKSVEDLRRVPGIGPKTLDRLRPFIRVDGQPTHDLAMG